MMTSWKRYINAITLCHLSYILFYIRPDQLTEEVVATSEPADDEGDVEASEAEAEGNAAAEEEEDTEAADSRGIPGWEKVDQLAQALVQLSGLAVTSVEAARIKQLYDSMLEYDRKPLIFHPRPLSTPRGRFGRSKSPSHVGVDHVKRYVALLTLSKYRFISYTLAAVFSLVAAQPPAPLEAGWWRLYASTCWNVIQHTGGRVLGAGSTLQGGG